MADYKLGERPYENIIEKYNVTNPLALVLYDDIYKKGLSDGLNQAITEFAERCNKKITEFILEHQEQLTFVSGVSMGWNIIDEIAEEMMKEV